MECFLYTTVLELQTDLEVGSVLLPSFYSDGTQLSPNGLVARRTTQFCFVFRLELPAISKVSISIYPANDPHCFPTSPDTLLDSQQETWQILIYFVNLATSNLRRSTAQHRGSQRVVRRPTFLFSFLKEMGFFSNSEVRLQVSYLLMVRLRKSGYQAEN